MKTNAIVRIVLFSLAIVLLVGILLAGLGIRALTVSGFPSINWEMDFSDWEGGTEAESGEFSADISKLDIDWASGNICIRPGDTDRILISETGASDNSGHMVYKVSGDTLHIRFSKTRFFFGFHIITDKDLTITVPRTWLCDKLNVDTASAALEVTDLTINTLDVDTASGGVRLENCSVGKVEFDSASGDLSFSGTLTELKCDTASGNCTAVLSAAPREVDMDSASGDLTLTLPASCTGFSVDLDSASGKVTSDFPLTGGSHGHHIYGDGGCRITADTASGDIIIRKAH